MNSSLSNGEKLTQESFDDFIERLRHHCIGLGVSEHCTADALFVVQARRIVTGIDTDYTEKRVAVVEGSMYFSPEQLMESREFNDFPNGFGTLNEAKKWELVSRFDDVTVTGYSETWEYVNCHFTKEAAEAFIKRKSHDYPFGLRVFVESQIYALEFNAIKNALISGELILRERA